MAGVPGGREHLERSPRHGELLPAIQRDQPGGRNREYRPPERVGGGAPCPSGARHEPARVYEVGNAQSVGEQLGVGEGGGDPTEAPRVVEVDVGHEDPSDLLGGDPGTREPPEEVREAGRWAGLHQRPAVGLGEEVAGDQSVRVPEPEVREAPARSRAPRPVLMRRPTLAESAGRGARAGRGKGHRHDEGDQPVEWLHRQTLRPSSGPIGIRLNAENHAQKYARMNIASAAVGKRWPTLRPTPEPDEHPTSRRLSAGPARLIWPHSRSFPIPPIDRSRPGAAKRKPNRANVKEDQEAERRHAELRPEPVALGDHLVGHLVHHEPSQGRRGPDREAIRETARPRGNPASRSAAAGRR